MTPERDLNPYAAPQSDVTPSFVHAGLSKRPASTKWALVLAMLFVVGYAMTMRNAIVHVGWSGLELSWMDVLDLSLRLACLVALLAGSGKPWGYYLGSATLAFFVLMAGRNLWNALVGYPDPAMGLVGMIFVGLMLLLWFRFTFGTPGRRYYRLLPQNTCDKPPLTHE